MQFVFKKTPRISVSCKLVPVQCRKYENVLLNVCSVRKTYNQILISVLFLIDQQFFCGSFQTIAVRGSCWTIQLRGCLHDTGATFAPGRVHSGSLSQLYICETTTKCHAGARRPDVSSLRFSHQGENFTPVRYFATVSCKRETTTRFGMKSVCR